MLTPMWSIAAPLFAARTAAFITGEGRPSAAPATTGAMVATAVGPVPAAIGGIRAALSPPERRLASSRLRRRPPGRAPRQVRACAGTTRLRPGPRASGTLASSPLRAVVKGRESPGRSRACRAYSACPARRPPVGELLYEVLQIERAPRD